MHRLLSLPFLHLRLLDLFRAAPAAVVMKMERSPNRVSHLTVMLDQDRHQDQGSRTRADYTTHLSSSGEEKRVATDEKSSQTRIKRLILVWSPSGSLPTGCLCFPPSISAVLPKGDVEEEKDRERSPHRVLEFP